MRVILLTIIFSLLLSMCTTVPAEQPSNPTLLPTATTPPMTATQTITPIQLTSTPLPPTPTPVQDLQEFQLISAIDAIIPGVILGMDVTDDGSIWLASDRGLVRLKEGVRNVDLTRFWDIVVGADNFGRYWVISRNGSRISAWDGTSWTQFDDHDGWVSLKSHPVFPQVQSGFQTDTSGNIWLATAWDIRRYDGRQWIVYPPDIMELPLPWRKTQYTSFSLLVFPDSDEVWVGGCDWQSGKVVGGGGIRRFHNGYWQEVKTPVQTACISRMAMGSSNHIWAGINDSLWQYDSINKTWTEFPPPPLDQNSELSYQIITDLPVSIDEILMPRFSLCGLSGCDIFNVRYVLENGNWKQINGIGQTEQEQVLFSQHNLIWVLTPSSVMQFQDGALVPVAKLDVITVDLDSRGKLWLVVKFNGQVSLFSQITN